MPAVYKPHAVARLASSTPIARHRAGLFIRGQRMLYQEQRVGEDADRISVAQAGRFAPQDPGERT